MAAKFAVTSAEAAAVARFAERAAVLVSQFLQERGFTPDPLGRAMPPLPKELALELGAILQIAY